jgi:hypothetical protein
MDGPGPEAESQARRAAKVAWAKMIRKVYEVDPLACPEIGAFASALSGFRLHQSISSTMFGIGQTCLVAGLACPDARIDPRQGRFSRRPDKRWRGSAVASSWRAIERSAGVDAVGGANSRAFCLPGSST